MTLERTPGSRLEPATGAGSSHSGERNRLRESQGGSPLREAVEAQRRDSATKNLSWERRPDHPHVLDVFGWRRIREG